MNVPNKLTLSRLVLTVVMVVCLTFPSIPFGKTLALIFFALAGVTDWWDGWLARRSMRVTAFGQLMDPLADKMLVSAAFIGFVAVRQIVPAWIAIIIVCREFLITGLRLLAAHKGRVLSAGRWGKHKMIWQTTAIVVIMSGLAIQEDWLPLFEPAHATVALFGHYFGWVSFTMSALVAVLTLVSGAVYLRQHRDLYMDDI
jgi:CDP-diacylglycerol---glycerol-3-phosphate 3-phosphatidyltransferase